jgi:hypothetical protein
VEEKGKVMKLLLALLLTMSAALVRGQCTTGNVADPPQIRIESIDLALRPQFAWTSGIYIRAWVKTCRPDTEAFDLTLLYTDIAGEPKIVSARIQRLPSGTVPASHGMPQFTFPFSGPIVFIIPAWAANPQISVREISAATTIAVR